MVDAYNKASGKEGIVLIKNHTLPNSIYEASITNFNIVIKFNEKTFWTIWLKIYEPIEDDDLPRIHISISDKPDNKDFSYGDLSFRISQKLKVIFLDKSNTFDKANFKRDYPLDEKSNQIADLFRQAFEYQILINEK